MTIIRNLSGILTLEVDGILYSLSKDGHFYSFGRIVLGMNYDGFHRIYLENTIF
jgi:hypothetical protein